MTHLLISVRVLLTLSRNINSMIYKYRLLSKTNSVPSVKSNTYLCIYLYHHAGALLRGKQIGSSAKYYDPWHLCHLFNFHCSFHISTSTSQIFTNFYSIAWLKQKVILINKTYYRKKQSDIYINNIRICLV